MKKILMIFAGIVTVLTLLTLVLDLPSKLKRTYAAIAKTPPPIRTQALFAHQETLTISPLTDDKKRGFMRFTWPSVYEIHNVTNENVTIADLVNVLPPVTAGEHSVQLQAEDDADRVVTIYDNFEALNSKTPAGVTERLPLTVKAGDKKYIKVYGTYIVKNRGKTVFCPDTQTCYQVLAVALGVAPKDDGSVPCIHKTFQTRMNFVGYESAMTPQKAVLLIPGCEINLQPLIDDLKKQ